MVKATEACRSAPWVVLGSIMAAEAVSAAGMTLVLPGMAGWLRIHKDPVHVGWIMSAFLLVSAMSAALVGRIGDIFGRKRVMCLVQAAVLVGALISALASDLTWLVAGRAIQGLCGAILPLALGLARENVPPERASFAVGTLIAAASASSAVCIFLGGVLIDAFGLNSVFYFQAALGLIAILAVSWCVPPSAPVPFKGTVDWLGGVLFAPAVALVLIGLSNGRSWGWMSSGTLGLIAGGLVLLAVWAWHESRHSDPLLDVRLLLNRDYAVPCVLLAVGAVSLMQLPEKALLLAQQPPWTGAGVGLSATAAGVLKLPSTAASTVFSIWAGWIAGRRNPRFAMIAGAVMMIAGTALGIVWHNAALAIISFTVAGSAGMATVYTAVAAQIVRAVPPDRTSEATGFMAVFRALAQGIGSQLLVILLGSSVVISTSGTRYPSNAAYELVLGFMLGAAVLILALAAVVSARPRGP